MRSIGGFSPEYQVFFSLARLCLVRFEYLSSKTLLLLLLSRRSAHMPEITSSNSNHQSGGKFGEFSPSLNQEETSKTSNELRLSLHNAGYKPVPVTSTDNQLPGSSKAGKAVLLPNWQNVCKAATAEEISNWSQSYPHWTNTGLLCGELVGIDIDVNDEALAIEIEALARKHLGQDALCRVGQPPKRILAFRTNVPFKKQTTDLFKLPNGLTGQVEVLGEGQQFVAFGDHPNPGVTYQWVGKSPIGVPFSDLPEVTLESVAHFLLVAANCLASSGGVSTKLKRQTRPSDNSNNPEEVAEALSYVPNADLAYDDWLRIGFAIHNGLGSEGLPLWLEWSAQSEKDNPRETRRTWQGFSDDRETKVTIGTLFYLARENGWRPSGKLQSFGGAGEKSGPKSKLLVELASPDLTVKEIGHVLASAGDVYDRAGPAVIRGTPPKIHKLNADGLVLLIHKLSQPYKVKQQDDGASVERMIQLPVREARMYLEGGDHSLLPPINGITSTPLLKPNGDIVVGNGYDLASGMFRVNVPEIAEIIPKAPTKAEATEALRQVRDTFKTFCFADAEHHPSWDEECDVVDQTLPPGRDESALLHAVLTAVCRPSLDLAPGILITASTLSGAGSGKGLLARCISLIAFGEHPFAVTGGANREETEKRITAELIAGGPTLFLDNLNNMSFRSDQLASAITEHSTRVRIFGKTEMASINAKALVMLTGNGLSVSEDLARRFLQVELDPKVEDPEARKFNSNPADDVLQRRSELLSALLTIWRWGRQSDLPKGEPLGSFETWCAWVRDPLIALGCPDPVERVQEVKHQDSERQETLDIFQRWRECHQGAWVTQANLDMTVTMLLDTRNRGTNALTQRLLSLAGTRLAGFHLQKRKPKAIWAPLEYRLVKTNSSDNR
jgi:hypothetical protein